MNLTITLIGIILIIAAIWVILELKRFRHRILAVFLICLLLFTYFSFTAVFSGKSLDLSSVDGIKEAGGIYFSWLSSIFSNVKVLSSNAIKMDWGVNNSSLSGVNLSKN
ncbi:MAG TPA: hypothetical protein VMC07_00405 [Candidatus Omnitrophota bacterium]|nr:hypothetical protein [Candidatus Omnitrophota bacterium]